MKYPCAAPAPPAGPALLAPPLAREEETSAGAEGEKKAFRARFEAEDWMRDGRESLAGVVLAVVVGLSSVFGLSDEDGGGRGGEDGGLSLGWDMLASTSPERR